MCASVPRIFCVSDSFVTVFLNPNPPLRAGEREMADCGNDGAVLQCTGLNVKLIFNV